MSIAAECPKAATNTKFCVGGHYLRAEWSWSSSLLDNQGMHLVTGLIRCHAGPLPVNLARGFNLVGNMEVATPQHEVAYARVNTPLRLPLFIQGSASRKPYCIYLVQMEHTHLPCRPTICSSSSLPHSLSTSPMPPHVMP